MPVDALAIAPVILAVVLVVSSIGKLRSPSSSAEAFRDLRVPALLAGRAVVRALPWAELALALLLVVASGWLGAIAAVGSLLLFGVYLVLVVRALGFEQPVDCACFGEFAPGHITRRTVVRNAWLLTLAVVALLLSFGGRSPLERFAGGTMSWAWLAAAAAVAVTTYLVAGAGAAPQEAAGAASIDPDDLEDYLRLRTPAVPVALADGSSTDLRRLSAQRAQLLLYVSETCGSCQGTINSLPGWQRDLPELDVRMMVAAPAGESSLSDPREPMTVHDPERLVWDTFDLRGTPSAFLLGADGLLAGGPVVGDIAVPDFVEEIRRELRGEDE